MTEITVMYIYIGSPSLFTDCSYRLTIYKYACMPLLILNFAPHKMKKKLKLLLNIKQWVLTNIVFGEGNVSKLVNLVYYP